MPELWNSSLSLLDKIELFDLLRQRSDVNRQRLFEAILQSQDVDLSSELVRHLTRQDLSSTLDWLEKRDWTVVLRAQWLSYLRQYQRDIIAWANDHKPSNTTVVVNDNLSLLWDTTLRRELWRSDYRVGSVNCCGPMTA